MDVLSDVLQAVRLSGAVFYEVEAQAPWVASARPALEQAPDVMPGFQHVMEYHIVSRGRCWVALENERDTAVALDAGSVVLTVQEDIDDFFKKVSRQLSHPTETLKKGGKI